MSAGDKDLSSINLNLNLNIVLKATSENRSIYAGLIPPRSAGFSPLTQTVPSRWYWHCRSPTDHVSIHAHNIISRDRSGCPQFGSMTWRKRRTKPKWQIYGRIRHTVNGLLSSSTCYFKDSSTNNSRWISVYSRAEVFGEQSKCISPQITISLRFSFRFCRRP